MNLWNINSPAVHPQMKVVPKHAKNKRSHCSHPLEISYSPMWLVQARKQKCFKVDLWLNCEYKVVLWGCGFSLFVCLFVVCFNQFYLILLIFQSLRAGTEKWEACDLQSWVFCHRKIEVVGFYRFFWLQIQVSSHKGILIFSVPFPSWLVITIKKKTYKQLNGGRSFWLL